MASESFLRLETLKSPVLPLCRAALDGLSVQEVTHLILNHLAKTHMQQVPLKSYLAK